MPYSDPEKMKEYQREYKRQQRAKEVIPAKKTTSNPEQIATAKGLLAVLTDTITEVVNADADVFISVDGTTNNLIVSAFSFVLYDLSTNAPPISESDSFVLAIGTQFYVKQVTAPTTGAVYLEGIYARGV